ncbi:MAG: TIGR02186 family protein [Hyphomicrobium sp.]
MRRRSTSLRMRLVLAAMLASFECAHAQGQQPPETIEADVSARNVSIEADFVGAEIVVFGTVENSRQPSPEAGTYDVVVIVEGVPAPVEVRRRSRVGGLWINTEAVRFASLPSYYAISSTRPIYDIAEADVLTENEIGFEQIRMIPAALGRAERSDSQGLSDFRNAVIRLKQRDGLYIRSDYGVAFVGRSLFRATMPVPPNVPVGGLSTRVFLFREGALLGQFKSGVTLQRAGVERFLHDSALNRPIIYGLATVLIAVSAGLAAALAFRREA